MLHIKIYNPTQETIDVANEEVLKGSIYKCKRTHDGIIIFMRTIYNNVYRHEHVKLPKWVTFNNDFTVKAHLKDGLIDLNKNISNEQPKKYDINIKAYCVSSYSGSRLKPYKLDTSLSYVKFADFSVNGAIEAICHRKDELITTYVYERKICEIDYKVFADVANLLYVSHDIINKNLPDNLSKYSELVKTCYAKAYYNDSNILYIDQSKEEAEKTQQIGG